MKTIAFFILFLFASMLSSQEEISEFDMLQESLGKVDKMTKLENRWLNQFKDYFSTAGTLPDTKDWVELHESIFDLKSNVSLRTETSWYPLGPESKGTFVKQDYPSNLGRVNVLEIHPNNTDCLFVGTPNGGLWTTENLGASWTPVDFSSINEIKTQPISSIAIDPINPDIIYVGTGDYDKVYTLLSYLDRYMERLDGKVGSHGLIFGAGVIKSIDGGLSWEIIGPNPLNSPYSNFGSIKKIVIDPENSNHIIVGGTDGLFESNNGGNDWSQILKYPILDFENSPVNFKSIWVSLFDYDEDRTKVLYCPNVEGGDETCFTEQNPEFGDNHSRRIELAISKSNPNFLIAVNVDQNSKNLGVYKTINGGINWTKILDSDQTNVLASDSLGVTNNSQGLYDLALAIDPSNENNIYIGGINIWASFDAGQTWNLNAFKENTHKEGVHADQHFFKFNSNGDRLFVCNDGGVYYTDDIADEATYQDITDGLAITEFYRVATYKYDADYLIAGAQDNSTFYKTPEGWNHIFHSDGMDCFIDLINPKVITGGSQYGRMWRSLDGGYNYVDQYGATYPADSSGFFVAEFTRGILKEGAHWVSPFHYDDYNNNIYVGFVEAHKYSNGAWQQISNFSENDSLQGPHYRIKQSFLDRTHLISIKHPDKPIINLQQVSVPSRIHLSKDDGEIWIDISNKFPIEEAPFPSDASFGNSHNTIFVSFGGINDEHKIYRSDDGGDTWYNYSKDLPAISINCIAHHYESEKNTIYLGTDIGVFYSDDEMSNWELIDDGFPLVKVMDLDINYVDNKLTAATYGRGIWQAELIETDLLPSSVSGNSLPRKLIHPELIPNINNGTFSVKFEELFSGQENFKYAIIDITGRILQTDNIQFVNNSSVEFDLNLLPGQYYLHASNENNYFVKKFIVQ